MTLGNQDKSESFSRRLKHKPDKSLYTEKCLSCCQYGILAGIIKKLLFPISFLSPNIVSFWYGTTKRICLKKRLSINVYSLITRWSRHTPDKTTFLSLKNWLEPHWGRQLLFIFSASFQRCFFELLSTVKCPHRQTTICKFIIANAEVRTLETSWP